MPLPSTMTPIATNTLSSTSATVTFSNIPQNYTDLVIITNMISTPPDTNQFMRFNSDSGTNYSSTNVYGTGSSALSHRQTSVDKINSVLSGNLTSASPSTGIYHIMNYSNTTTYKTMISRFSGVHIIAQAMVTLYRSTSAINAIEFFTTPQSFAVGSITTLYGIKAAS